MWTTRNKIDDAFIRDIRQAGMRSMFKSLFWSIICHKREAEEYSLKELSNRLRVHKSAVSRWFAGDPNWSLNTIAEISDALDVDIQVTAIDRRTGMRFSPSGETSTRPFLTAITNNSNVSLVAPSHIRTTPTPGVTIRAG